MSEHTPDHFSETSSEETSAEVSSTNGTPLQAEQAVEAEQEVLATTEETPQAEPSIDVGTAPTPENTLPPEAQGEANGGPLGCCLGMMIGLLLSLSLAVFSRFYADPLASVLQGDYGRLGLIVRILMGILAFVLAIFFGYVGWKLGKRFYREYEPPVRKRRSRAKKLRQRA
jgi:hypothetical protein